MRRDSPYRRPDGRELRSERTRARIFDAAIAEFLRVGFDAASVARIARLAGVSRPSFYFHFPSKEHVVLELQWQLQLDIVEAMARHDDLREGLHAFVDGLIEAESATGSMDLFREILNVWVRPPADVDVSHLTPVLDAVRSRFEQAARESALPAGLDAERTTLLFLSGVFGYLIGVADDPEQQRHDLHALVSVYLGDR